MSLLCQDEMSTNARVSQVLCSEGRKINDDTRHYDTRCRSLSGDEQGDASHPSPRFNPNIKQPQFYGIELFELVKDLDTPYKIEIE